MMSGYTVLISGATAIGPLIASFIVQYSPGGWRDYIWVCAALAGANLFAIFFLYPESNFHRPETHQEFSRPEVPVGRSQGNDVESEKSQAGIEDNIRRVDTLSRHRVDVVKKPWMSIWTTFITVDEKISLMSAFTGPLVMLAKPAVLLATFLYGIALASQVIIM